MADTTVQERLLQVQQQLADACQAAGRSPEAVTLVGVSKTQPAEAVLAAYQAGLRDFGENRPEEAAAKIEQVNATVTGGTPRWHMIGHVQSRKARLIVPHFAMVHSLDSIKLAGKFDRLAGDAGKILGVLLECNISGEAAKAGWHVQDWENNQTRRESLWNDIQSMLGMSGIRICGLMTMAPIVADPEMTRPVFAGMQRLQTALRQDFPQADWSELSMGMSDDFPVAISEGATIVRIGRAIFGARQIVK